MKKSNLLPLAALNLLFVLFILVPFLPGPPNELVIGLSGLGQLAGFLGLVLVPLGVVWLIKEIQKQGDKDAKNNGWSNGYYFAILGLVICVLVYLLPVIGLTFMEGSWGGPALFLFIVWALWRAVPGIKKLKRTPSPAFNATPLYFLSIPLVAFATRTFVMGPVSDYGRHRAIEQSQPLITAIEEFNNKQGHYPESLEDLRPGFMRDIPKPAIMGIQKFQYEKTPDAYNLSFVQWQHVGATKEVVMYNKHDRHNVKGHFASHDTKAPHWRYYWLD